jgi:hypothetical protein
MTDQTRDDEPTETTSTGESVTSEKRPYHPPTLVEYGSVAKLTKGTKSVNADGPGNTMKKNVCL